MSRVRVERSELKGRVRAPPSKSYTHRALFVSALAEGRSKILNPLISLDTLATINALRALGVEVSEGDGLAVESQGFSIPEDVIDVENSGTTLRILTSLSSLTPGGYCVITGDESVRRRPMQPLLDALRSLGVWCASSRGNGLAPVIVKGGGMDGGEAEIPGWISSQFITSLLISGLKARQGLRLRVKRPLVSKPYVDSTLSVIRAFGGDVLERGWGYEVPKGLELNATTFEVPGDFSSASFLMVAGAMLGEVEVLGLRSELPQADERVVEILRTLGVDVEEVGDGFRVRRSEIGKGVIDLSDSPDLLPALAPLGLLSDGIEFRRVWHARLKESDRISALAEGFRALGAKVEEFEDGLRISKGRLRPAVLDPRGDHRLFMSFFIAGMLVGGVEVKGSECVAVSYPEFLRDMRALGGVMEVVE